MLRAMRALLPNPTPTPIPAFAPVDSCGFALEGSGTLLVDAGCVPLLAGVEGSVGVEVRELPGDAVVVLETEEEDEAAGVV